MRQPLAFLIVAAGSAICSQAHTQGVPNVGDVVNGCGNPNHSYVLATTDYLTVDRTTGRLCTWEANSGSPAQVKGTGTTGSPVDSNPVQIGGRAATGAIVPSPDGGLTPLRMTPSGDAYVIDQGATNATVVGFQQTATASAVVLPTNTLTNGLVCTALVANTGTVYMGPSGETSSTGYPLAPGNSMSWGVTNSNALYMLDAVTTDKIACSGN